jgi:ATP-binding cassette subfamily B protein
MICLMLVSTIAEVLSLGAVVPFLGVLMSPERVFNYPAVAHLARAWHMTTANELVLPLTVTFGAAALIAGAIRMLQVWASTRFAYATGADISVEVYRRTLHQSYAVQVTRGSDKVISGITQKAGTVVLGALSPLMVLINSTLLMVALMSALIVVDPLIALIALSGFGASYGLIALVSRRRLQRNSRRVADEYTRMIKSLQEGLGGIRDVLLDGTQSAFCAAFRQADSLFRRAQGENFFIAQSPKAATEAVGMVLIAALAYGLSRQPAGMAAALPVLGALAIGAQRLLPALQQAYAAWAAIGGSHASLADTLELLDQPLPEEMLQPPPPPLQWRQSIRFDSVRFRYANDRPWVLDGFNLIIPKGTRVGVVGDTGSGKSTMLDLLMALLLPTEGEVLVDREALRDSRIRAWQQVIAHVPQSIFLADVSVAENIAFGVPRKAVDMERVRRAAHRAQIADFIESTPQGYETRVGERGVRLSGGQCQRIGIARALYKQATVLVMDEATSALDNITERSVMEAIEALDRDLTILLIAHRLTTVQRCDVIVELKNGRVAAQGSYEQLLRTSASFRHLALATKTA